MPISVTTKVQISTKPVAEPRSILGPTGNRVRASEDPKRKTEAVKKPQRIRKPVQEIPAPVVRNNVSTDSSCSSDSSSSRGSTAKKKIQSRRRNLTATRNGVKNVKVVVPDGGGADTVELSPKALGPCKRCDWITSNSGT